MQKVKKKYLSCLSHPPKLVHSQMETTNTHFSLNRWENQASVNILSHPLKQYLLSRKPPAFHTIFVCQLLQELHRSFQDHVEVPPFFYYF